MAGGYDLLKKEFHPIIEVLLIETEHFDELATENCAYCSEVIKIGKLVCVNEHNLVRCCISMVQVQMLSERHCPSCEVIAMDDLNLLYEIIEPQQNEVLCPFCDRQLKVFESGFTD